MRDVLFYSSSLWYAVERKVHKYYYKMSSHTYIPQTSHSFSFVSPLRAIGLCVAKLPTHRMNCNPKNENQDSKGMEKNSFKVWLFSDCNFVRVSFFAFCPILLFLCLSLRWIVVIVLLLLFQVDFTSFCRSSKPGNNNRFSNQIKCFMQHPTTSKKCQSSNQPRQLTTIDNIVNAVEFKQELPGQH